MAAFILSLTAKPSFSAIFNVASDFSLTNNPNGAWRYGWSSSLGSSFNLYNNVGKLTPTIVLGGLAFSAFIAKMRMKRKRQQKTLDFTGS